MAKPIKARGLTNVAVKPGGDDETVALVLSDTAGKHNGYLIGPEGLNALLEPLLGLAAQWADKPDLEVQKLLGPHSALPAHHISIERGRNNAESALRVFVGKIELTFLIPLDSVLSATAQLVKQIDPKSGKPAH